MRVTAIGIMMTVCTGTAAVQLLPGDGECVKVYQLDAEIDAGASGVYLLHITTPPATTQTLKLTLR